MLVVAWVKQYVINGSGNFLAIKTTNILSGLVYRIDIITAPEVRCEL